MITKIVKKLQYCSVYIILFCVVHNATAQTSGIFYPLWQQSSEYPQVKEKLLSKSYLLMEYDNNQVLLQKNIQEKRSIASLTKLMTALVIVESITRGAFSLTKKYPVMSDHSFVSLSPYASRMYLSIGDNPSGEDLLKGILIVSGNDAALYVASIISNTVEDFVVEMNKKAQELGLQNTFYNDPTGLSEKNISTAYDLALLTKYILSYSDFDFLSYTSQSSFFWKFQRKNTNKLMGNYTGIDGLKTGYIEESGFNIIVTAIRNSRRVVAIILGIEASSIVQGVQMRSKEAEIFLNFAYNTFSLVQFPSLTQELSVWGGKENSIQIASRETIVSIPNGWVANISKQFNYGQDVLIAPIEEGEVLANIVYATHVNTHATQLLQRDLYAIKSVKKGNIFKRIWHKIYLLFL